MPEINVPKNIVESNHEIAESLRKNVETVRRTLRINRGRTQFHNPRWHFWRAPEVLRKSRELAEKNLEAFRKANEGALRVTRNGAEVPLTTAHDLLSLQDWEITAMRFGGTEQQNRQKQRELRQLLQQLWQAGGLAWEGGIEGDSSVEQKKKRAEEMMQKMGTENGPALHLTIEMELFHQLSPDASRLRGNLPAVETLRSREYQILVDLNQRRLLSQMESGMIDDFLVRIEDYAEYVRLHAATLPANARDSAMEKQAQEILTSLLENGSMATRTYQLVFATRNLEANEQRAKLLDQLIQEYDKYLKGQEEQLKKLNETDRKGKRGQDIQKNIDQYTQFRTQARTGSEDLRKEAEDLRKAIESDRKALPERDVVTRTVIEDGNVADFINNYARRRFPNGNIPAVPTGEAAQKLSAQELTKVKQQALEAYQKNLPECLHQTITPPRAGAPQWILLRTLRLNANSSVDALEECHGEFSRAIRSGVNASVDYQAYDPGMVKRMGEQFQGLFGVQNPVGPDRRLQVRLPHAMYANMLTAHGRHLTEQQFPQNTDGGRQPQAVANVLVALQTAQLNLQAWSSYGQGTMAHHATYQSLLAGRGQFGPYIQPQGNQPLTPLPPDIQERYWVRPLPPPIQQALHTDEFNVTSHALEQYMFMIVSDFAPRLQTITMMEDAMEYLDALLEPMDKAMERFLMGAQLPNQWTTLLGRLPELVGQEAWNIGFGDDVLKQMSEFSAFREQVQKLRKSFQESRKRVESARKEIEAQAKTVHSHVQALRKLMVMHPPETLAAGTKADREIIEQYRKILQNLESSQMELMDRVQNTIAQIDVMAQVNSLMSNQRQVAANLPWLWTPIVGVLGWWWTMGFPRIILNPMRWGEYLQPSARSTRYFRHIAAPWAGWVHHGLDWLRSGRDPAQVQRQLQTALQRVQQLEAAPVQNAAEIAKLNKQIQELRAEVRTLRMQAVEASVSTLRNDQGFQALLNQVRTNPAAAFEGELALTQAHINVLSRGTAPAALEGLLLRGAPLTAAEIEQLHALCQLRIQAGARALGLTTLTDAQALALLRAHFAGSNVTKLNILRQVFTIDQALVLLHGEIRLAGIITAGLNPQQATRLAQLFAEGETSVLRGLMSLSEQSRGAVLALEQGQASRILALCEESASLRNIISGLQDARQLQTLARNLEALENVQNGARAIRELAMLDEAAARSIILVFSDSGRAAESAALIRQFGQTGRLAEQLSFLRRAGQMFGRGFHFVMQRIVGPAAVAIETYFFVESITHVNENAERANNVINLLRSTLHIGQANSKFEERTLNGDVIFEHKTRGGEGNNQPLCTINGSQMQRQLESAVGIDVARSATHLAGVIAAGCFMVPGYGWVAGSIIMVGDFIVKQALKDPEARHWIELLRDLPPELLVLLPTSRLREVYIHQDRGPYAPFLLMRNYYVRRAAGQIDRAGWQQAFNALQLGAEIPGLTLDSLLKQITEGEGSGLDAVMQAIQRGDERSRAIAKQLRERLEKEWNDVENPLAASLFHPLYHEIVRLAPPQLIADRPEDVVRTVWEDRALLLQSVMRFLPELGFWRWTFGNEDFDEFQTASRQAAAHYARHRLTLQFRSTNDQLTRHRNSQATLQKGVGEIITMEGGLQSTEHFTNYAQIITSVRGTPAEAGWRLLAGITAQEPNLSRIRTAGIVEALEGLDLQSETLPLLRLLPGLPEASRRGLVQSLQSLPDLATRTWMLRRIATAPAPIRDRILALCTQAGEGGILTSAQAQVLESRNIDMGNAMPGATGYTIREQVLRADADVPTGLPLPRWNAERQRYEAAFTQTEGANNPERVIPPENRFTGLDAAGITALHELGAVAVKVTLSSDGQTRIEVPDSEQGMRAWKLTRNGITAYYAFFEGRWYWSSGAAPAWQPVGGNRWGEQAVKQNAGYQQLNDAAAMLHRQQTEFPLPLELAQDIERGGAALLRLHNADTESIHGYTRYVLRGTTPETRDRRIYFACLGGRWHKSTPQQPIWARCTLDAPAGDATEQRFGSISRELCRMEQRFDPDLAFIRHLQQTATKNAQARKKEFGGRYANDAHRYNTGNLTMEISIENHQGLMPNQGQLSNVPVQRNATWDTFEFRQDDHGRWEIRLVAVSGAPQRFSALLGSPMLEWAPLSVFLERIGNPIAFRVGRVEFYSAHELLFRGARPHLEGLSRRLDNYRTEFAKDAASMDPLAELRNSVTTLMPRRPEDEYHYLRGNVNAPLARTLFGNRRAAPTVLTYGDFPGEPSKQHLDAVRSCTDRFARNLEAQEKGEGTFEAQPQAVMLRSYTCERDGLRYEVLMTDVMWGMLRDNRIVSYERHVAVREQGSNSAFTVLPSTSFASATESTPREGYIVWRENALKEHQAILKSRFDAGQKQQTEKIGKEIGPAGVIYCALHFNRPVEIESGPNQSTFALHVGNDVVLLRLDNLGNLAGFNVLPGLARRAENTGVMMRDLVARYTKEIMQEEAKKMGYPLESLHPDTVKWMRQQAEKQAKVRADEEWASRSLNEMRAPQAGATLSLTADQMKQVKLLEAMLQELRAANGGNLYLNPESLNAQAPGLTETESKARASMAKIIMQALNAPPQAPLQTLVSSAIDQNVITFIPGDTRFVPRNQEIILRSQLQKNLLQAYNDYLNAPGQPGFRPGEPVLVDTIQNRQRFRAAVRFVLHPQTEDPLNAQRFAHLEEITIVDAGHEVRNALTRFQN